MIQVIGVTEYYGSDYNRKINEIICEKTKCGWKFIDIKHSVAANNGGIVFSALLLFDDSPTADDVVPTSLNQ